MDEQTRLKAREFLLRSRIYRFIALVFACIGFILFIVMYLRYVDGNILDALRNPFYVVIIVLPFLPAFILSWMAMKAETQFLETLEILRGDAPEKTDKQTDKPAK